MKERMEDYRTLIAGFLAGVLGWLEPIAGDVFTMIYLFVLNFGCGYLADRFANGNDFDFKKALRCILEAGIFFVVVDSIYIVGIFKEQPEEAVQCVSTVVYVLIYFYGLNILRNLRKLLKTGTPAFKVVDFLYYLLSFEIIKKIPVLNEYLERDGTETKEDS